MDSRHRPSDYYQPLSPELPARNFTSIFSRTRKRKIVLKSCKVTHSCRPGRIRTPVSGFGDRHATAAPRARIMTIFTDCHYQIPFKQTNHTLSKMTDLPAPGQRINKKQLSINKLELPSSAILPHGLERASAALRYAPKDFPAL